MLLLSHRRRERWRLGWECMADDGNDADAAQARRRRRGASAARLHRDADQPPPLILRPGNLTSWAAGVHKTYLSSVAVCFQITVLAAAPTTGCACVLFCARVCASGCGCVCVPREGSARFQMCRPVVREWTASPRSNPLSLIPHICIMPTLTSPTRHRRSPPSR